VLTVDGTSQTVTVTIQGRNDAAVITGPSSGTVIEAGGENNGTAGTPTATGDLNSTDVDNPNDAFQTVAAGAASVVGYGTYAVTAAGVWTYTLDNTNADVQALNVGDTLTDTFNVLTVDGTSQTVTVTVQGRNDAAVITGDASGTVIEAGGVSNGTPGTPTATGDLNSTDVDNANDAFQVVAAGAASSNGYGSYAVAANGVWTYALDNTNSAVQALNVGNALTDTFNVLTVDGTSQTVTVTIQGRNDAAVITGPSSGTVVEAGGVANGTPGTPTATGDLNSTDVDNPSDAFQAVAAGAASVSGYGTYAISAAGIWSYTLDNTNAAVQALNVGDTLTDTFNVLTIDGTAQTIAVTIQGRNDAAVIAGNVSGTVVEAGPGFPGTPVANGTLTDSDVDNAANTFLPVGSPTASAAGYGTFTMSGAGAWTYTLDNSNPTVDALNNGSTLNDSFTVQTADGTSQVVAITIQGTTDFVNTAPSNITLTAVPPGDSLPSAGTLATLATTDPDPGDTHTYSIVGSAGIFAVSGANLNITSALGNNNVYTVTIQSTDSHGGSYQETFNVITGSGTTNTLPTSGTGMTTDDLLYGFNNADLMFGGTGDDSLFGQTGDDTMDGGAGNDLLSGGAGQDNLTGGSGADTFRFDAALSASTNVDTITDFLSGTDRIQLAAGIFTALAAGSLPPAAFDIVGDATAPTASTRIIYNQATGALSYDADGTGAGAAVQIAIIGTSTHPALVASDFQVA
jgi:VCBS repeat-containing protein